MKALAFVAVLAAAWPCLADDQPSSRRVVTSTLDCHGAQLTAVSTYDPHFGLNDSFVWFEQVLTLKPKASSTPKRLVIDPAPTLPFEGRQRLSRAVYSWACVHGASADYLVFMVGCTRDALGDDRQGVCHGQREWMRIIDLQGHHLDAGFLPQDPRYPALMRRLGLPDTQMRSVIE